MKAGYSCCNTRLILCRKEQIPQRVPSIPKFIKHSPLSDRVAKFLPVLSQTTLGEKTTVNSQKQISTFVATASNNTVNKCIQVNNIQED